MARPRRLRDPIEPAAASVAMFVGSLPGGSPTVPALVTSFGEFVNVTGADEGETADAVRLFFENDGRRAYVVALDEARPMRSFAALADTDFNILVLPATARVPGAISLAVAAALYAKERGAYYIADPPAGRTAADVARWAGSFGGGPNSAVYFPRLRVHRPSGERDVVASGAVAGIFARIEMLRGLHVAPEGIEARVSGVLGPSLELDDATAEALTQAGVNPIRRVPPRTVLWAARTREDTDTDWQFIKVRRLALFLERSVEQGLQWVVFEPNGERLWTQVRAAIRVFLNRLFRQGLFPAARPRDAFFVRCDRTTMTQDDIDSGRLVIHVGIAPLRPAEFLIVRIGLRARSRDDG
jgi:phage tail sheath protein FI